MVFSILPTQEDDFECRSAEFEADTKTCVLSREDRRTQPEAFRKTVGIDYIENQCVKSKSEFASNYNILAHSVWIKAVRPKAA